MGIKIFKNNLVLQDKSTEIFLSGSRSHDRNDQKPTLPKQPTLLFALFEERRGCWKWRKCLKKRQQQQRFRTWIMSENFISLRCSSRLNLLQFVQPDVAENLRMQTCVHACVCVCAREWWLCLTLLDCHTHAHPTAHARTHTQTRAKVLQIFRMQLFRQA